MVREIKFDQNVVTAKVQGSRRTPYKEKLVLRKFTDKELDKLVAMIQERPVVLSKLFNRQMDESLSKLADASAMPLFPRQWRDIDMECSCPDWAVPCKHLAAVIYQISLEIDNNPFLVFSLHGVDLLAELEQRGLTPSGSVE
ncbi:MAG: SWIM zinc finger family protein [Bacteroidales bacterium]|nr:SWIM zinc finger family protein [Bacteroidales bacterium]